MGYGFCRLPLVGKGVKKMEYENKQQAELGRRSEHRESVDQYHSVELTVSPNRLIYQFRINQPENAP